MGHYVYKYVYNNEIIYIGKNDTDLYSRLKQHGKHGDNIPEEGWNEINNSDVFYCELANSIMSDVVESELIRRYKPKWNKAKTSEWCGINFVEPNWKNAFELDKDTTITEKNITISKLKSTLDEYSKKINELKKIERYKDEYFSLAHRYDELISQLNKNCISNDHSYQFEDICQWYKNNNSTTGVFEAITYNSNKNITSYKKIYIDFLGRLYFEFEQINRKPVSGIIFDDKKDITKKNWAVLRSWMNAGSNEYIKIA